VARALLAEFGGPVVAPSANRSGHVSPTTAAHVLADLNGSIDLVVDGGAAPVGLESSIVACVDDEPTLLRAGAGPRGELERVLGRPLAGANANVVEADEVPSAPGMLRSHYAPRTHLRLDATTIDASEVLLAFGPPVPGASRVLNLSLRGDLVEAAANLFS